MNYQVVADHLATIKSYGQKLQQQYPETAVVVANLRKLDLNDMIPQWKEDPNFILEGKDASYQAVFFNVLKQCLKGQEFLDQRTLENPEFRSALNLFSENIQMAVNKLPLLPVNPPNEQLIVPGVLQAEISYEEFEKEREIYIEQNGILDNIENYYNKELRNQSQVMLGHRSQDLSQVKQLRAPTQPLWQLERPQSLNRQFSRVLKIDCEDEELPQDDDLDFFDQILTQENQEKIDNDYKKYENGQQRVENTITNRKASAKNREGHHYYLVYKFSDFGRCVLGLCQNENEANFSWDKCKKIYAINNQIRPTVDFFTFKEVITMYQAGKTKICESCATGEPKDDRPFYTMCENCNQDDCFILVQDQLRFTMDVSNPDKIKTTPIIKCDKPEVLLFSLINLLMKKEKIVQSEVLLDTNCIEYKFIQFSVKGCVKSVTKYHHWQMLQQFLFKYNEMQENNKGMLLPAMVKMMFFGTREFNPADVMKQGVQLKHRHSGNYGKAFYFYKTTELANVAAYPNSSAEEKSLLFGFVLVGDYVEKPPQQFAEPPDKPDEAGKIFDSLASDDGSGTIIVHQENRFYPCYLISYL